MPDDAYAEMLLQSDAELDRIWSYTQVRDWLLLHPLLTPAALRLYCVLRALIIENDKTGTHQVYALTRDKMCWLVPGPKGKPTGDTTIREALALLVALHLFTIVQIGTTLETYIVAGKAKPKRVPTYRLVVHDFPRDDYAGWRSPLQKLAAYTVGWRENPPEPPPLPPVPTSFRRPVEVQSTDTEEPGTDDTCGFPPDSVPSIETAGQSDADESDGFPQLQAPEVPSDEAAGQDGLRNSAESRGIPQDPAESRSVQGSDLHESASKKTLKKKTLKKKNTAAPSARSAADARRASDVGNASASAAPSARQAASAGASGRGGKFAVAARRREVLEQLPERLVALLPKNYLDRCPPTLRKTVDEQLQVRTVDDLAARIADRWRRHYSKQKSFVSAVGVAVALVRAGSCPEAMCEGGVMLPDRRVRCVRCEEQARHRSRGGAARTERASTQVPVRPVCTRCERPFRGAVPEDLVCGDCVAASGVPLVCAGGCGGPSVAPEDCVGCLAVYEDRIRRAADAAAMGVLGSGHADALMAAQSARGAVLAAAAAAREAVRAQGQPLVSQLLMAALMAESRIREEVAGALARLDTSPDAGAAAIPAQASTEPELCSGCVNAVATEDGMCGACNWLRARDEFRREDAHQEI